MFDQYISRVVRRKNVRGFLRGRGVRLNARKVRHPVAL
jgi:hypothetical protein